MPKGGREDLTQKGGLMVTLLHTLLMKYFLNHRLKEFPKLTKIHKLLKTKVLKLL